MSPFLRAKALAESIVNYLKQNGIPEMPKTAIILGTGLGGVFSNPESNFKALFSFKLDQIKFLNAPEFTVEGHIPQVLILEEETSGSKVVAVCGRVHFNELALEPHRIDELVRIPRALALAGVKTFFLTNAVGGITHPIPGTWVQIIDHDGIENLNPSPFFGNLYEGFGPKFFDCSKIYDQQGTFPNKGVLQWVPGPNFETPQQISRFERDGIAVVGMSVVPEATALAQMRAHASGEYKDIKIYGFSIVSNSAAGKCPEEIEHEKNQIEVEKAGAKLNQIVRSRLCKEWAGILQ